MGFLERRSLRKQEEEERKSKLQEKWASESTLRERNKEEDDFERMERDGETGNGDFTKREFDFDDGLQSVIEIAYDKEQEVPVKLFFSRDDYSMFSRNYTEKVKDNFVRFVIDVAGTTRSIMVSGGNYDFKDDFDKGYTLFVIMKYRDRKLLARISKILRSKNFGCLPTNYSIHAHLNNDFPTEDYAKSILKDITTDLTNSFHN